MPLLELHLRVEAFGVRCWACGTSAYLASCPTEEQLSLADWMRAHRDPRMVRIFSSCNGGPMQAHLFTPAKPLRP